MHAIPLREDETYYPDSDGEPVAESPAHLEEMVYVWEVLDERFEDDPNVFVGANMFLYYRKGDPRGVVAPDGFVVKGVPKLPGGVQRRKSMLWLEGGQVPCFVLETTPESTAEKDRDKRRTYAQLGPPEIPARAPNALDCASNARSVGRFRVPAAPSVPDGSAAVSALERTAGGGGGVDAVPASASARGPRS